jgi:hypothetical protein
LVAPELKLSDGMNDRYVERTDAAFARVVPAVCTVVGELRCANLMASARAIGCATESALA